MNSASAPPESWEPFLRLARLARRPLDRFLRIEAASGVVLLVCALVAFAFANSPLAPAYAGFWRTPIGFRLGDLAVERPLEWFVNDGLMVIFFFVVGMEIRREIHHGELSEWRRAVLPGAAALGGMIVPALLYTAIAGDGPARSGWGVPMATDIAFAVGILTLLGERVPPALRVLLLALAVIDDLGAIVVIALFYSSGISAGGLLVAGAGVASILAMRRLGIRSKAAYVVPGFVIWAGVYAAGIHPTIAGVVVGLLTPVRAWLGTRGFVDSVRAELEELADADLASTSPARLADALRHVDAARREAMSPAESLIETLHPWVAYGIMPLFALANAAVSVTGTAATDGSTSVVIGVAIGLVIGKPLGVLAACAAVLRSGFATLPVGIDARHLVVLGLVAGVGFTMALFVAQLAFASPEMLAAAKVGVLGASVAAAIGALVVGRTLLGAPTTASGASSADEAESSTEL